MGRSKPVAGDANTGGTRLTKYGQAQCTADPKR